MLASNGGVPVPGSAKELAIGASWVIRGLLVVGSAAVCYSWQPFALPRATAGVAGALFAALVLVVEMRLRRGALGSVLGGAIGTVAGTFAALATSLLVARTSEGDATKSCLEFLSLFAFAYLGLMLGSSLGADFVDKRNGHAATGELRGGESLKLLDTSVLIDGRIADICEAHFMDGVLGVPQFILHELQMVADSSDTLKRQRGRRGLEILQRMQKLAHLEVRILDDAGIPTGGDVDAKLVELARSRGAKIVTNDFNLNKVATLQGIAVLNVNLLANAMKPAVLPGEPMRVLVVREGKEPNRGVAYLDDGTMVVVDGARKLIGKNVDVVV
ncbi:MAG TPA: PIN domain-containing protein, partial [Candidatus Dormibacteraeota bacterium]|nr:PIN domain-containing protein [Candidatus Dormibacteraeota bacterium]